MNITLPVIILDVVTAGIIIYTVVTGWRKGLSEALLRFGVTIVSLAVAWAIAMAFTPMVSGVIEQNIGPSVRLVTEAMNVGEDMLPDLSGISGPQVGAAANDALSQLGISNTGAISSAIARRMSETGQSVKQATESTLYGAMAFSGLFVFGFILARALLEIGVKAFAERLPIINKFNKIGGALTGIVEGMLIMCVLGWAVQFLGMLVSAENIEQTFIFRHFANFGIFDWLSNALANVL